MEPIRFDPNTDLSPIPFTMNVCRKAAQLKDAGLEWKPHVGCFVWDRDEHIEVESPFPGRIYFVLSMKHFLRIFGTVEEMVGKLIWLPTWHQTRLVLKQLGVGEKATGDRPASQVGADIEYEFLGLYDLLLTALHDRRTSSGN